MIDKALVIYHANCDDGFGAALAFWKLMAPTYSRVDYHPGVYGEVPPPVDKETSVWILDFSYDPETLCRLSYDAGTVRVLDHHISAKKKWDDWVLMEGQVQVQDIPANLYVTFDMSRSGAMLTYEYLKASSYSRYNKLFEFLQDRDLWKFENPDTQYFTYYLRSFPQEFAVWDKIAEQLNSFDTYEEIIRTGCGLERFFDKQCADIIATCAKEITIDGKTGLAVNCTGQFASDIGNTLAKTSGTFGCTYYTNSKGQHIFSLRSEGDFDVSQIASKFGGGGHKNAAGFKLEDPTAFGGVTIWNEHNS